MKNADLIRRLPSLPAKKRELAERQRKLQAEIRAIAKLEELVDDLAEVGTIIDGIALKKSGGLVEAAGDDIRRCGSIYLNAHNKMTYGLHTYTDAFGRQGEKWHGANLTKAEAERMLMDWVIRGKR